MSIIYECQLYLYSSLKRDHCSTNLSNLLGRVLQRRRHILHTRSCDEAVKPLVLLCDLCYGGIKPGGILNVHLAVVDRTSKLVDTFLSLVEICRGLW
jgi:hypothetical protein